MMNILSGDFGPRPVYRSADMCPPWGSRPPRRTENPRLSPGLDGDSLSREIPPEEAINFLLTFVLKSAKLDPATKKEDFA